MLVFNLTTVVYILQFLPDFYWWSSGMDTKAAFMPARKIRLDEKVKQVESCRDPLRQRRTKG